MKRTFIIVFFLIKLLSFQSCEQVSKVEEQKTSLSKQKYNILMVVADDLNDYGIFHTYPQSVVPNLDSFSQTAITFKHSYCASPECNPSRAAFLSGMYPHRTGAYLNGGKPWVRVMQEVISLPEHLKANGYTTFGMGKLFHGELPEGKEVRAWDNEIKKGGFGRALEALDKGPNADNTIVIFFSDNGYHCGEKDNWEKSTLWEQAALVPTMIRFPGSSENGKVCTRPINLIDLYPTLIEACGLTDTPHSLDGNSIFPLFENVDREWNIPSFTSFGKGFASVRTEEFRYLQYPDGTEELYDHRTDQFEWKNVAENPQLASIKTQLRQHVPKEWAEELQSDKWDEIRAKRKKQRQEIQ